MANNIRELRIAFALSPREMAGRLGVDIDQYRRLEEPERSLTDEWVDAVARALHVQSTDVTGDNVDFYRLAAATPASEPILAPACRIAVRYSLEALIAKLGGADLAASITDDDWQSAAQNVIDFVAGNNEQAELDLTRLSQALQIAVLTILRSRGVEASRDFPQRMRHAVTGAQAMIEEFSRLPRQETQ